MFCLSFREFLNESAFANYKYTLPDDPEQQLYDFYMLSLIQGAGKSNYKGAELGYQDYLEMAINDTEEILLPELKKRMLSAMLFSLAAEMRHVFNKTSEGRGGGKMFAYPSEIFGLSKYDQSRLSLIIKEHLGSSYRKVWDKYQLAYFSITKDRSEWWNQQKTDNVDLKTALDLPDKASEKFYSRRKLNKAWKSQDEAIIGRQDSYSAAIKARDKYAFVEICDYVYNNFRWEDGYGGPSWGSIAKGWIKLHNAKQLNEIMIYIDHAYDLQHNNGTVFDKIRLFHKDDISKNGIGWLARALDLKRDIKDPHALIERVSLKMRTIAMPALKIKYGKTLEQMKKEKPEEINPDTTPFKSWHNRHDFDFTSLETFIKQWGKPIGKPLAKYAAGWAHGMEREVSRDYKNPDSAIEGLFWSLVKYLKDKGFEATADYYSYSNYAMQQYHTLKELENHFKEYIIDPSIASSAGGVIELYPKEVALLQKLQSHAAKIDYQAVVGDIPVASLKAIASEAGKGYVSKAYHKLRPWYPSMAWAQLAAIYLYLVHSVKHNNPYYKKPKDPTWEWEFRFRDPRSRFLSAAGKTLD